MQLRHFKQTPVLIAAGAIALVCLIRVLDFDALDRLERQTYDLRVRVAQRFPQATATNLGFVFISDESITALSRGLLGQKYGLLWPSHVYGRLLRELAAQDARVVAFDVLLPELRYDHAPVLVSTTSFPEISGFLTTLHPADPPAILQQEEETRALVDSDDFLAWQLNRTARAVLAAEHTVLPHPLFASNAVAIGDISADRDTDGVLRRARAFRDYRRWHLAFKQAEFEYGFDLSRARIEPDRIILSRADGEQVEVEVDAGNDFALADFGGEILPPGLPPRAKAFVMERVWHMGIVMAAHELNLDLATAEVNLRQGRITFHGPNGMRRTLPVDSKGYFYINWELTAADRRLCQESIESLLAQDLSRSEGEETELTNRWRAKLVAVGSSATGNNLTDRGATPLEQDTLLVSKHWNVANSLIQERFIGRTSMAMDCALIALLGLVTAVLTWRLRVFWAAGSVLTLALLYSVAAGALFVQTRLWLPLVLPVVGAMFVHHGFLVTYRVVIEQQERRRVRSVFSRIVSPEVVNELLRAEKLALGGARREISVLFADVRGFTDLTDELQARAAKHVKQQGLTGGAAEAYFNEAARETLDTVNPYLALVADVVKQHHGTLDKYIGDCAMAFWGAPTPDDQHARHCVQAAIEAQRAVVELNRQRTEQNGQLEPKNRARAAAGLPPATSLATLTLGMGINTGYVTVGLMGSEDHLLNFTVFGHEVNLASRLEHEAGRGSILISEATFVQLQRGDPALARRCVPLKPVMVKGIRDAVKIYEVTWHSEKPPTGA